MDFDHDRKHSAGNLPPIIRNSFPYAPSPYPESLYNVRSGPSSLVHLPCCSSPGCSSLTKFYPEPSDANIMDQNVRHHPYQSPLRPLMGTDYGRRAIRNFYPDSCPAGSMFNERRFDSHANYQNVKMSPNLYENKLDGKADFKPNPKRRKRNKFSSTTIMPNVNFPAHSTDNYPRVNYDPNISVTSHPYKEFVNVEEENEYSKYQVRGEPYYASGKKYPHEEVLRVTMDNAKYSMHNSNDSEKVRFMTRAAENAAVNSGCRNAPVMDNFINENENFSKDFLFDDAMTNSGVNNFESKNSASLSNCQVTHATIPENNIFNIQDVQQENLDLASYFFQTSFEGKNENGENVAILVSDSNTYVADLVNTNISTNDQRFEAKNNEATLTYLLESSIPSSETSLESQFQEVNKQSTNLNSEIFLETQFQDVHNVVGGRAFFSDMDDYSDGTVTTSKKEHYSVKKTNTSNENPNKKHLETVNQIMGGNCTTNNFVPQPSTSRENEYMSTNVNPTVNPTVNPSNPKCSRKGKHFRVRQQMPKWRKRLLWKFNEPVKNMQHAYFRRFMKKVKHENEQMMLSGEFWNMYKLIVTRIGGSVMQTMYNILPALIRNSRVSLSRANDAASMQTM